MAVVVNAKERLKPMVFVASLPLNKQRTAFLDEITDNVRKCGVKRDNYWIIDVRKALDAPGATWAKLAPSFGRFLIAADKNFFSLIMIQSN